MVKYRRQSRASRRILKEPDGRQRSSLAKALEALRAEAAARRAAEDALTAETMGRKNLREELARVVTGARCFTWRAEVRSVDMTDGMWRHDWNLHVRNEDLVKRWLTIPMEPELSFAEAMTDAVLQEDQYAKSITCGLALSSGQAGYSQEYRLRMSNDEILWMSESVVIETLAHGHWHLEGLCTDITEVKRLQQQLEKQIQLARKSREELESHHGELAQDNARLEELVSLDGLTGLKNHRACMDRLDAELQYAARCHTPLSLIMLDVDRFKQYNDVYGHLAGDEVLRMLAGLLKQHARDIDFAARYGGEEFAIIVPADEDGAVVAAERLRVAIEQAAWPKHPVTASFGVSTLSPSTPGPDAAGLIAEADQALYYSKERSRNRVTHAREVSRYTVDSCPPVAINAGGEAVVGSLFLADRHYTDGRAVAFSSRVYTGGVQSPAPEDVYGTERVARDDNGFGTGGFAYEIPGLMPDAVYHVRLHFAELFWEEHGKRLFDVTINGAPALTAFDIVAEAGEMYRAIVKEFIATTTATGAIVIAFKSVRDHAKASGIEIIPFRYRNAVSVNCGGGMIWPFTADRHHHGGHRSGVEMTRSDAEFELGGLARQVPGKVYQTERYGNFIYTIPDLTPGASYLVHLHFSEFYWTKAAQRVFNVAVNGAPVLTNFDIVEEAGGPYKAVVKQFSVRAGNSGQILIEFAGVVDNAQVNAIEVLW